MQGSLCRLRRHGHGRRSVDADLLCVIESWNRDDVANDAPSAVLFVHLCLASGKHAHFPSEETFAVLEVVSGHQPPFDYSESEGIELEYRRCKFVKPTRKCKPPLDRQTDGPLMLLTDDDLAAHIMFPDADASTLAGCTHTSSAVKRVAFRPLSFNDVSLLRVRVSGCRAAVQPVWVGVKEPAGAANSGSASSSTDTPDFSKLLLRLPEATARPHQQLSLGDRQPDGPSCGPQLLLEELGLAGLSTVEETFANKDAWGMMRAFLDNDEIEIVQSMMKSLERDEDDGDAADSSDHDQEEDQTMRKPPEPPPPPSHGPPSHSEDDWIGLGLKEPSKNTFVYADNKLPAGKIHELNTGKNVPTGKKPSMKATCAIRGHTRCVCWVSLEVNGEKLNVDLVRSSLIEWIAAGRNSPAAAHQEASRTVKQSFGMRVRT